MAHDPETDLVLERMVNAPRDILFKCWTTPEHLMQFFVPKPHRVTACTLDPRVGGAFNTTFDVNGTEMHNTGVFLELIAPEKIVFTDAFTAGWKPAPDPFMTAIILFDDAGDGRTAFTAIARHRTPAAADRHKAMGFHDGWGTMVSQLDSHAHGMMT